MECGTELAATEFGPSYRRAAWMQASLAALGLIAGIAAWLTLHPAARAGWMREASQLPALLSPPPAF
jgi:hypothetical protein